MFCRWKKKYPGGGSVRQLKLPRIGKARLTRIAAALRMRIREIAQTRVRYGYWKIEVLLNREGWRVGKYLAKRIYRKEGSTLLQRRKRRRRIAERRRAGFHPTGPNQVGSKDFVADQLADGRGSVAGQS